MNGVAALLILFFGQDPAWAENTPIPAERTHCIPGWTVGRFLFCQDRDSLDAWVAVQGKDGLLAGWSRVKNTGFTDSKWSNPVLSIGPRVYAFGHWGQARTALLEPAGRMGAWKNCMREQGMGGAKEPLLWGAGALAEVKGRRFLYHLGGFEYEGENFTNPRSQNKVFYAQVRPDGFTTDWLQTTRLPYHPMGASAVVHDGRLYCMGGRGGRFDAGDRVDGMVDDILSADVKDDGTLGGWTLLERKLPWKGCGIAAFVRAGWLHVAGGEIVGDGAGTATAFSDGFARAKLEDGALGPWEMLPSLPAPAGKTPSGFIGDHFYLVGLSKAGKTPVYSVRIPCER